MICVDGEKEEEEEEEEDEEEEEEEEEGEKGSVGVSLNPWIKANPCWLLYLARAC
jgi:hypothetical protein